MTTVENMTCEYPGCYRRKWFNEKTQKYSRACSRSHVVIHRKPKSECSCCRPFDWRDIEHFHHVYENPCYCYSCMCDHNCGKQMCEGDPNKTCIFDECFKKRAYNYSQERYHRFCSKFHSDSYKKTKQG